MRITQGQGALRPGATLRRLSASASRCCSLEDAEDECRRLAREEGIFTGVSGGASFAVGMQVAERAPEGSVLLVMLPDTGERYLSTPLFEGIEAEMDDEEIALMKSTPGFQME